MQAEGEHTVTRRLHVGFVAASREHVDSSGESAPRRVTATTAPPRFLLDPGGSSAEAVHHGSLRAGSGIDHLWMEAVDRFHRDATGAGYRDNGAPGERPIYDEGYYEAYVLDPDGNNVEVVNHNRG